MLRKGAIAIALINVMTACAVSTDDPALDEPALTDPEQRQATATTAACDSRVGLRSQDWFGTTTLSQYGFRSDWCTVGSGLPPGCYSGFIISAQFLAGSFCATIGPNGVCFASNALWQVTCSSLLDCVFNCNGQCVPVSC